MKRGRSLIHALKVVAGFSLVGTVTAGALFGWLPALGVFSIHEIGAVLGAGVGVAANAKHLI